LAHNSNLQITGIDISEQMLSECAANAALNGREIELINADILKWKTDRTFDAVITNPPYFKGTAAKHGAHHNADLYEWTRACLRRVRPRGYFYIIIDSAVMDKVIAGLHDGKAGDMRIIPLYGAKGCAERVLISARSGANGGAMLLSGLSMNDERVLRDGLTISELSTTIRPE
jgi:tRNA1(Val) A37 N6-methylase TrmN6